MDFKVACFFLQQFKLILLEALFDSWFILDSPGSLGREKYNYSYIYFCLFAQVGMALILLSSLPLCIGTKCTHLIC